jgi:hypothetical protein
MIRQSLIAMGGLLIAVLAAWISLLILRRIIRLLEEMKKGADYLNLIERVFLYLDLLNL